MNPFKGGFTEMLQHAARFKEEVQKIQDDLANRTVEGTAGAGMVKVTMNGKQHVLSVFLDPQILSKNDAQMLQDLIAAAVNDASRLSQELAAAEMGKLTAGLGPLGSLLKGL